MQLGWALNAFLLIGGCTLTSTGGYLHSSSTNEVFGGVHATIAETLVPTLESNNCILLTPDQARRYEIERRVTETFDASGSTETVEGQDEFLVANSCNY